MIPLHQVLTRLLFAAAMGALIGVERDLRRRPAGIRTSMFVCLATALFTIMSGELAHLWGDSSATRIASNIVQNLALSEKTKNPAQCLSGALVFSDMP